MKIEEMKREEHIASVECEGKVWSSKVSFSPILILIKGGTTEERAVMALETLVNKMKSEIKQNSKGVE